MKHAKSLHQVTAQEIEQFQQKLIKWYWGNQPNWREMPWRRHEEPTGDAVKWHGQRAYEVWVSEVMLQQTQVATVVNYYKKWMEKWPTIYDLAKAEIEQVNEIWSGLGYYSRAKRLLEGAKLVVEKYEGILPKDPAELEKNVPGIGPYTAGAITSIAYSQPSPLVDGNVIRVFSRFRTIGMDPKSKEAIGLFWDLAKQLIDKNSPGEFNQALMDLGATVCMPTNPTCKSCPINTLCLAYQEEKKHKTAALKSFFSKNKKPDAQSMDDSDVCTSCMDMDIEDQSVTRYPIKIKKKGPREEAVCVLIIECKNPEENQSSYFVSQRPESGLLGGLWDFPHIPITSTTYSDRKEKAAEFLMDQFKVVLDESKANVNRAGDEIQFHVKERKDVGSLIHLFSHIKLEMWIEHIIIETTMDNLVKDGKENTNFRWFSKEQIDGGAAVPATFKKALSKVKTLKRKR